MDIVDVAAALVFRGDKLLITQRPQGSHLAGLWEFPGGKREKEETFQECLVRELAEELGIEVTVGDLFETIVHNYPEKTVRLKFFYCRWSRNEPRPLGCPAFQWIGRGELSQYEFPPADAVLLQRLRSEQRLWAPT
jgi:mutator protein MutT